MKRLYLSLVFVVWLVAVSPAFAQSAGQTAIDVTQIIITIIGGVFTIIGTILAVLIPYLANKYIKDKQAAVVVGNAIKNSLGKIQQAGQALAEGEIRKRHPNLNVPDYLAPGVQYVIDHAGTEAERFGLTPEAIADKIIAQLGLKNIETNLAITQAATPVTTRMGMTAPVVAGPLAPVPQAEIKVVDPGHRTYIQPESPSSEGGDAHRV